MSKATDKLKKEIIRILKREKLYESTDLTLIDELIFNIELIAEAKADVKKRGININLRNDEDNPFYQLNNSLSVIQKSTKIIQSLYSQLGIDVITRIKKADKKVEDKKGDALDRLNELLK